MAEIERPLKSSNMRDIVSEWDANFIAIPTEELMDLIVAANFLLIQPLLDVAFGVVGGSESELREGGEADKGKNARGDPLCV